MKRTGYEWKKVQELVLYRCGYRAWSILEKIEAELARNNWFHTIEIVFTPQEYEYLVAMFSGSIWGISDISENNKAEEDKNV